MNLVAKEYVAAQDPDDPGVLILSRFAGAAAELTAALLVNPYDPEAVGTSISHALSMPSKSGRTRHKALFRLISENDLKSWGELFLASLTKEPDCRTGMSIRPAARAQFRLRMNCRNARRHRMICRTGRNPSIRNPMALYRRKSMMTLMSPGWCSSASLQRAKRNSARDQAPQPVLVGAGECLRGHLVVPAIGVDRAKDAIIVEHHGAIEPADIDVKHRSRWVTPARQTMPAGAVEPRQSRMTDGAPVHSIRMSGASRSRMPASLWYSPPRSRTSSSFGPADVMIEHMDGETALSPHQRRQ